MTPEEIREGAEKLKWWHSINLGQGYITKGSRRPTMWDEYQLPMDLRGKRVLDVGSRDGYFAFEAERRGASYVLATDLWGVTDDKGSCGDGRDCFEFAHKSLNSSVDSKAINVYDITPKLGMFDVTLFLQVFYHLEHPYLAMQKLAAVTVGSLVIETVIDAEALAYPAMIFYPFTELHDDPSCWWGPNIPCLEAMGAALGFPRSQVTYAEPDGIFRRMRRRVCITLFRHN